MHKSYLKAIFLLGFVFSSAVFFTACQTAISSGGGTGAADAAATVNGKNIKMEEVEKILKAQFQGAESKLSDLELTQYRLQALDSLIQEEVMVQRAEKEKVQVTDDEINQAFNEHKQASALSADEYNKKMQEAGETEATFRDKIRRQLMIKKLGDKIAATVEPPKDSEIEGFFKGNPDLFINKRGASFAAIVIDPSNTGPNDPTKNKEEAANRLRELASKLNTPGLDFGALVREYSEDPQSAARGGEWQALTEDQMKQLMGDQVTAYVMDKMTVGQIVPTPIPLEGRTVILKLSSKNVKDENLTLESPNVKQRIIELLTNAKKQLLTAAYQLRVMDESRVENFLAKRVVDNPNNLSGARPAPDPNAAPSPSPAAAASPAVSGSPAASPAGSPAAKPATSPAKQ